MTEVPLTQGRVAIIDGADSVSVCCYRWHAVFKGGKWYARRSGLVGEPTIVYMHHFILNPPNGYTADHIDGDGLNNQRFNLRAATQQQQCWNRRKKARSAYKGVSWQRNPRLAAGGYWRCTIQAPNGQIISRSAKTQEAAARIYNVLAQEYFGEFAWLNALEAMA